MQRLRNFLVQFSRRLDAFGDVLVTNIFSILTLGLVFAFYWQFPQAKDLLLTLNQDTRGQVLLFLFSLTILAAMVWYLPRLTYPQHAREIKGLRSLFRFRPSSNRTRSRGFGDPPKDKSYFISLYQDLVPRASGTLIILIVGIGILNVAAEVKTGYMTDWVLFQPNNLLLISAAFVLLLGPNNRKRAVQALRLETVSNSPRVQTLGSNGILGLVLIAAIIFMLLNNKGFESLSYLSATAIIMGFGFLAFTLLRKYVVVFQDDLNVIRSLIIISLVCLAGFILLNIFPDWSQELNPLTCFNMGLISYLVILYTLRIMSVRTGTLILFYAMVIVLGFFFFDTNIDYHEVSYVQGSPYHADERVEAAVYFDAWMSQRQHAIDTFFAQHPGKPYPVFIVSSEGGGSRAAYWGIITQAHFQRQTEGRYYQNHLLALTGASGGTTGNATFFSMMEGGVPIDQLDSCAGAIFRTNFLSSSLTLLLGKDALFNTFNLPCQNCDRGKALECEWTEAIRTATQSDDAAKVFESALLSHWYTPEMRLKQDLPPLLMMGSTHVQSGGQALASPVKLSQDKYLGLDILHELNAIDPSKTLPIKTLNLLNASFPYVNPAGHIEMVGNFADAGYFDNHGARTAAGIAREFQAYLADKGLTDSFQVVSLLMINATVDKLVNKRPKPIIPTNKNLNDSSYVLQTLAPAIAIAQLREGAKLDNLWYLTNVVDTVYTFPLRQVTKTVNGATIQPIVPLARYLSETAVNAMDTWHKDQTEIAPRLHHVVGLMQGGE